MMMMTLPLSLPSCPPSFVSSSLPLSSLPPSLQLYLDHTSIGHTGERFICMGLESSTCLSLTVLTGFRLGFTFARMGFPPEMEALTNEQVGGWSHHHETDRPLQLTYTALVGWWRK